MIPKHVDVNSPDIQGQTPFYVACQNGHLDVVQTLLGYGGVDVNDNSGHCLEKGTGSRSGAVSYTHLRAHET